MKWKYHDTPREGEEEFGIRDKWWSYGGRNSVVLILEEMLDHWHAKLVIGSAYSYCTPIKGSTDQERQEKALKWARKEWDRIRKAGNRVFSGRERCTALHPVVRHAGADHNVQCSLHAGHEGFHVGLNDEEWS